VNITPVILRAMNANSMALIKTGTMTHNLREKIKKGTD
jgi:hypothetical protein